MRRLMYFAASLMAAAAVFAACNKETQEPVKPGPEPGSNVIRVTIPDALTKVSLTDQAPSGNGMALAWQNGDAIRVTGETSELYTIADGFDAHSAEFTGNPVEGSTFTILYPGSFETKEALGARSYANQTQNGNGNSDHLTYNALISGVDTYEEVAFTEEWAAAHGGDFLQNGVLKLVVSLPGDVSVVKEAALVSSSAIFNANNMGTVKTDRIAVALENVDVSASGQVLTAYMNISAIDVPLEAGQTLTVKVVDDDAKEYSKSFEVPQATALKGGKMNTIRLTSDGGVEVFTDYFISVSGAGNMSGEDWDDAMNAEGLRMLLGGASARADAFDGVTFHFATGTYYLAEGLDKVTIDFENASEPIGMTFLGGYPENLHGTAQTGRDAADNVTAFSGGSETGIFEIGSQAALLFDGITFKDVSVDSENAGALYVAAADGSAATVTVTDCRFTNNRNTSDHTGASIILGKNSSASIEDCYFADNYARNAPALHINAGASAEIKNCKFENNSSSNTSGAAQNGGSTDVTFLSCFFKNNTAGSWGGGAFHTNGSAETRFTGCDFVSNSAPRAGAISIEKGNITFTSCSFTGNTASYGDQALAGQGESKTAVSGNTAGGAILLRSSTSACTLNDCVLEANKATNGAAGAIGVTDKDAQLTIGAGTSFIDNTAFFHGASIHCMGKLTVAGTSGSWVTFTDEKTLATGNQHANGGAIYLSSSATATISYAKFDGCEAGQEDGSTVNYSNGGAISVKGTSSLQVDHSEFTGCRGRNGNALNLEPGDASVCKFTDCKFDKNIGKSGGSKDGTSGNFHGGVARLGGSGTAEFERCTFTQNTSYNGSGVLHINAEATARMKDCTVSGNWCENGTGGCSSLEYGALYLENCTFSENYVKAVDNNTGRHGGVFYLDVKTVGKEPVLEAVGCVFEKNYTDTPNKNPFGGVMRVQGNSPVSFTDCVFDGNHSAYRGGIFGLNEKTRLKMNRCVIKNNYAASGGMIQGGANALIYMNQVTFYNNYTTNSGGWGVAFHNGNNNACLNNCTLYGNKCTNASPGNNISLNSDGGWLVVNTTVVDDNLTAVLRANGTRKATVCNNIFINRNTADNIFVLKSAGIFNDLGHNVYSFTAVPDSPTLATTDLIGQSDASLGGSYSELWNASDKYGVYSWTNSLSGFTAAAQTDVESALKTGYPETDSVHTDVTNIGLDFYNWLVEIGAVATDGRGVARTAPWWPGAYQN